MGVKAGDGCRAGVYLPGRVRGRPVARPPRRGGHQGSLLQGEESERKERGQRPRDGDGQEVERMLIAGLREQYPDTRFIGEESVAGGAKCELTDHKTWVIDPIDGTTNFVSSNPNICTILALLVSKQPQFCIVFNPILNQLWTAKVGHGAFYNGEKIRVSSCNQLSNALLIQEMGSSSEQKIAMVNTNLAT